MVIDITRCLLIEKHADPFVPSLPVSYLVTMDRILFSHECSVLFDKHSTVNKRGTIVTVVEWQTE
jgi:hypothetical protein